MEKSQITVRWLLWATLWMAVISLFVGLAFSFILLLIWCMSGDKGITLSQVQLLVLDLLVAVVWSFLQMSLGVMYIAWVAQAAWRWWRRRTAPDKPVPSISILAVLVMILIVAIANVVELVIRQQFP